MRTALRTSRLGFYFLLFLALALTSLPSSYAAFGVTDSDKARGTLESIPDLQARYGGYIGERVDGVVKNWETRVLKANPVMLSVFQMRERTPRPSDYYVPWVGEFIGKYLENAMMLLRMTGDLELQETIDVATKALMASQDRDGYLGPYSKPERLVVNRDLWGHYHVTTALLHYYSLTGSVDALEHARRAGLFFEKVFYRSHGNDGIRRVKDVSVDEVNFAIMTSLCQLYRITGETRFLDDARYVLSDLETSGDFYRKGLAGTDFFRTSQPFSESLYTILGLGEFFRAEGDENYRRSFLNLWESIFKRDVHNNGSFSQSTGNSFNEEEIETCGTVAWIVATVEALRLSGDPRCADALENSLYNAVCAYTHPSGSWCACTTPMNGRREASFHTSVVQSRPGQPELNCCSVDSPRGFGELVNWGVMLGENSAEDVPSVVVNFYGEGSATFRLGDKIVTLVQKTNYPTSGRVELSFAARDSTPVDATLKFRVPEWAIGATMILPDSPEPVTISAGTYASTTRTWTSNETIFLDFPMSLRYISGDGVFAEKASIYYGPLLLACDQFFNSFDVDAIPTIVPDALESAEIEFLSSNQNAARVGFYTPQLFVKLDSIERKFATDGSDEPVPIFLTDFAHAGSLGSSYSSWISITSCIPPVPACEAPVQDASVAPGVIPFTWRKLTKAKSFQISVIVSSTPDFTEPVFTIESTDSYVALAQPEQTKTLIPYQTYYWKVVVKNEFGTTESLAPGRRFHVDPNLPTLDLDAYRFDNKTDIAR